MTSINLIILNIDEIVLANEMARSQKECSLKFTNDQWSIDPYYLNVVQE